MSDDYIRIALKRFEPRMLPRTMRIERDAANEDELTIRFVVRADMRAVYAFCRQTDDLGDEAGDHERGARA